MPRTTRNAGVMPKLRVRARRKVMVRMLRSLGEKLSSLPSGLTGRAESDPPAGAAESRVMQTYPPDISPTGARSL